MKKLVNSLNYIGIGLILVGFAVWRTYEGSSLLGPIVLAAGVLALLSYLYLHRELLKNRNMRMNFIFAGNLAVLIILVLAILAALNYLGTKAGKRFDLSEGKIHSLADQSIQVVRNLKEEINIKGFFADGNPSLFSFRSLMDLYRYYSDRIRFETIDPYKNPALVKHYDIKRDGTLVLEYGDRDTRVEEISEEAITNALIKITRDEAKTIYFTRGHGEPDLEKAEEEGYSEVKANLESLAFQVKSLLLFQEEAVPEDAAALVIAGPKKPLLEGELALIEDYLLQRGGRVLLMLNPFSGAEWAPLLEKFGLALRNDIVVETSTISRFMSGDAFMPVVGEFPEHSITRNFSFAVLFPYARSLEELSPVPDGVRLNFIAQTSRQSWGETSFEQEKARQEITRDENDYPGPLNLAAVLENETAKNRLVVIGNADFALNRYYYFQGNGNFFTNIVSWLAEEEDLIAIAPKTSTPKTVHLTQSSGRMLFFYTLIILPLFVFLAGIAIWFYRRRL